MWSTEAQNSTNGMGHRRGVCVHGEGEGEGDWGGSIHLSIRATGTTILPQACGAGRGVCFVGGPGRGGGHDQDAHSTRLSNSL